MRFSGATSFSLKKAVESLKILVAGVARDRRCFRGKNEIVVQTGKRVDFQEGSEAAVQGVR